MVVCYVLGHDQYDPYILPLSIFKQMHDNISQAASIYIPEPTRKWDVQVQWPCWSQAEALATFRVFLAASIR